MAVPVINVSNRVKVRQVAKNDAQYGLNVLNYECVNATGAPVPLTDFAVKLDVDGSDLFKPLLSAAATYIGYGVAAMVWNVVAEKWEQATPEYYADAGTGAGTGGASLAPTQGAPLVSWRTDSPSPSGRGRTYIPFAATSALSASSAISGAYRTLLETWANFFGADIVVNNGAMTGTVTMRPVIRSILREATIAVARYIVRNYMATQRRRGELNRSDVNPFAGSIHIT